MDLVIIRRINHLLDRKEAAACLVASEKEILLLMHHFHQKLGDVRAFTQAVISRIILGSL